MRTLPSLAALALLASCAREPAPDGAGARPDVLLVSLDTLRADRLSCYGNTNATSPFLDSLAAEGVRFASAHAPSTNTTPSHMSLFTGLDPMTHGVHEARPSNKPTAALRPAVRTLPQLLHAAGWRTAAFTDRGGLPPSLGFGRGFEHLRSEWESLEDKVDALGEFVRRASDEPLFVFFHTYEVHAPYLPPRDLHGRFAAQDYAGRFRKRYENLVDLPVEKAWEQKAHFLSKPEDLDADDVRWLSALYDEGVAHADRELARMWELWSAARDPARTLVVVLSDHGEEFLEHQELGHKSLHAELVRVPLIVRGPSIGRGVVEQPVSLTGVHATLLDLLGLPVPPHAQAESFAALLREPADAAAAAALPPVFTQADNKLHRRVESVAVGSFRLLRTTVRDEESLALFDWTTDPFEQRDVAAQHPERVAELVALLDRRRAECDHLRTALGPAPEQRLTDEEIAELRALGYVDEEEDE